MITRGSGIHDQARENLIEYERYMAEQKRHKPQPPPSHVKTQSPLSSPATNKEYRRWFRRTRPSTRSQGYFHYSGGDEELAKVTSFTTPGDFVPTPKVIRRFVSSGKAPTSRTSTGGNKKRRRSAEHSSGVTEGTLSVGFLVAFLRLSLLANRSYPSKHLRQMVVPLWRSAVSENRGYQFPGRRRRKINMSRVLQRRDSASIPGRSLQLHHLTQNPQIEGFL